MTTIAELNANPDTLAALVAAIGVTCPPDAGEVVSYLAGSEPRHSRLVMRGEVRYGGIMHTFVKVAKEGCTRVAMLGDSEYDSALELMLTFLKAKEGVLMLTSTAGWVAKVVDPTAARPVYDFMKRCPGGFEMPGITVGDILVWGGKDSKGRKTGPYYRLVTEVKDSGLRVIKADYLTARGIRRFFV